MIVFKKFDISSILDEIDAMVDFQYISTGNPYRDFYDDQIVEIANIASDMYEEVQSILRYLEMYMPYKELDYEEEDYFNSGRYWWNTAVCFLEDTDILRLLENEDSDFADPEESRAKRLRALNRTTKKQQTMLFTVVLGFITRFQDLANAFAVVEAVMNELQYHQSAVNSREGAVTHLPDAAYL